jgi:hypothetical protein
MSPRGRSPDSEAEQLVNVPPLDETERAESMWLLARDSDPSAVPPSPATARDYQEIEDLLGNLPPRTADTGWHKEVLRRVADQVPAPLPWWRRTSIRWAITGAFVAGAAALLISRPPRPPQSPELEVATWRAGEPRDLDGVSVGDRLVVTARPRAGIGDLRIYLPNGTLVARCPRGPACSISNGREVIDITLEKPVQYQVILAVMAADAAHELPGDAMQAYLDAARAANARIILSPPIDVH